MSALGTKPLISADKVPSNELCEFCGTHLYSGPHEIRRLTGRGRRTRKHKICSKFERDLNRLVGLSGKLPFDGHTDRSEQLRLATMQRMQSLMCHLTSKPETPVERMYGLDLSDGAVYRVVNRHDEVRYCRFVDGAMHMGRYPVGLKPVKRATFKRFADTDTVAHRLVA